MSGNQQRNRGEKKKKKHNDRRKEIFHKTAKHISNIHFYSQTDFDKK